MGYNDIFRHFTTGKIGPKRNIGKIADKVLALSPKYEQMSEEELKNQQRKSIEKFLSENELFNDYWDGLRPATVNTRRDASKETSV